MTKQEAIKKQDIDFCYRKYLEKTNWAGYWWDAVCEIFHSAQEFAKTYILDEVKGILTKIKYTIFENGVNCLDGCKNKCYLVKILDIHGNRLASKIGTTTETTTSNRWKSWLKSETAKRMEAFSIKVERVYDCFDRPAEGLESLFRAKFIQLFPDAYVKNDRFFQVDFPLEEADKLYKEYFALAQRRGIALGVHHSWTLSHFSVLKRAGPHSNAAVRIRQNTQMNAIFTMDFCAT